MPLVYTRSEIDFDNVVALWDADNPNVGTRAHRRERAVRRALYAAMWFIENVRPDDAAREDLFFRVRELSRAAPY